MIDTSVVHHDGVRGGAPIAGFDPALGFTLAPVNTGDGIEPVDFVYIIIKSLVNMIKTGLIMFIDIV